MAYKDEYEVARLYADGSFREMLAKEFQDVKKVKIHLAPPLFARKDVLTGRPRKIAFGGWIFPVFSVLTALKSLREGPFDLFGRTAERRLERALRDAYLSAIPGLVAKLSTETLPAAVEIASAPLDVRGFGIVKTSASEVLLARLSEPHAAPA
jgi:indolepyruvate ferredoxin oxidoreductase